MSQFSNMMKQLRPDLPDMVKMPIFEATELAKSKGYVVRLVEVDGEPYSLESTFCEGRINFKVEKGIVVEVGVG